MAAVMLSGCAGSPSAPNISAELDQAAELTRKGKYKQAQNLLARVRQKHAENWQVDMTVYTFWVAAGRTEEAVGVGEDILERVDSYSKPSQLSDNQKSRALTQVAYSFEENGDEDRALNIWEMALEMNHSNAEAANAIAWTLAERGEDLDRALMLAKRAVKLEPESGMIADTLGWVYFKQKKHEPAEEWLKRAVKLEPNSAELRQHLAEAHFARKNIPSAYVENRKALLVDPRLPEALVFRKSLARTYNPPGPL